ncbi:site-specific DNA-methyltransferase [Pseudomonas aeruginosa]|uniref:site-specific DNA-methyltransferase n=1 Tax=Pseudomonas aeruginosa TaxID=287 RepID=UPI0021CA81C8|nr:DNA methyltransferase [Pseudomonas aeruginosa]
MEKLTAASPEAQSADLVAGNIEQLKALFPELLTEGKDGVAVNVDVLKALVGDATVTDADEKYGLNWHGKRRARQLALTPSTGTLRPCPEDSVDWDTTQNLMIEGDNLEVLKLLQKSYAGKVKLIYIDPPYNQDADVVYQDDFVDSIKNYQMLTGQVDSDGRALTSAISASGRFHTQWLNMVYPRLRLARDLLANDGVILVSIDDGEVQHLKTILAELFGEDNSLAVLIWNKQHSQQQGLFKRYHEYVLCFARRAELLTNIGGGTGEIDAGALKKISRANPASDFAFPAGVRFDAPDGAELSGTFGGSEQVSVVNGRFVCEGGKTKYSMTLSAGWTQRNQMESWFSGKETIDTKGQKVVEFYFNSAGKLKCRKERTKITPSSLLPEYGMVSAQTNYLTELMGASVFPTPKPVAMLQDFLTWFASPGDIVMDFFAGSGTLGEASMRSANGEGAPRFVLVQLPEPLDQNKLDQQTAANFCDQLSKPRNIAELTKERLRRAGAKIKAANPDWQGDTGFRVFKLDTSNIRAWNPKPDNLEATLFDHQEHLLEGRSEADVLYELLLKLGLDLCVPIEKRRIEGLDVHAVGGGVLLACLAEKITREQVESLAQGIIAWHKELAPAGDTTCVFRDSAFEGDVAKTNMAAILQQHGIANVRSL